jgi:UPF0042 nucleotide-binding protein
LEDLGFFCIDNLPGPVVAATLDALGKQGVTRIGLGVDVRVGAFFDQVADVVDRAIDTPNMEVSVLFLDASDEVLLRRFVSTRRPHPVRVSEISGAHHEAPTLLDEIRLERSQLAKLRDRATTVVDTTSLNVHDLRRRVVDLYGPGADGQAPMRIRFVSFGFKYGAPIDADLVFDVRFLKNPFFVEDLRHRTGQDPAVSSYVLDNDEGQHYVQLVDALLDFCLPLFQREGKTYLTVAVGCTGGQHRSVAVANAVAHHAQASTPHQVDVVHRDAERNRMSDRPLSSNLQAGVELEPA